MELVIARHGRSLAVFFICIGYTVISVLRSIANPLPNTAPRVGLRSFCSIFVCLWQLLLRPETDTGCLCVSRKCVKPDGRYNGIKIKEKDVIRLQAGVTGFSAHDGDKLETKKHFHLGLGNGMADLRGQNQGPRSLGGLQFYN